MFSKTSHCLCAKSSELLKTSQKYFSLLYRLIVIADKDTVYKSFPIPLINRLEKHYIVTATCIQQKHQELVNILKQWAHDFASVPGTR